MIATIQFKSLRSIGLILLVGFLTISGGYATGSTEEEKKKTESTDKKSTVGPEEKEAKADSIASISKEKLAKTDSTSTKPSHPSSMSSMSYNILFQVIYRFSFSEIFDSPSSSEIVSH